LTNAKRNERDSDRGPDMTNAGWMTDALQIADGILAEGEGDLTKMGEFEDVEFKVSIAGDGTGDGC
jgi:kinetochore protein Mis13/DSN1